MRILSSTFDHCYTWRAGIVSWAARWSESFGWVCWLWKGTFHGGFAGAASAYYGPLLLFFCFRFFVHGRALSQHNEANHSFEWGDCDKDFAGEDSLKRHQRTTEHCFFLLVISFSSAIMLSRSTNPVCTRSRFLSVVKSFPKSIRWNPINGALITATVRPVRVLC